MFNNVDVFWQGRPIMKIVYRPESSTDSLNSEEKALYDELQRELLELRRNMRNKENENAKQVCAVSLPVTLFGLLHVVQSFFQQI